MILNITEYNYGLYLVKGQAKGILMLVVEYGYSSNIRYSYAGKMILHMITLYSLKFFQNLNDNQNESSIKAEALLINFLFMFT